RGQARRAGARDPGPASPERELGRVLLSPLAPRRSDLVLAALPLHPPEDRDHRRDEGRHHDGEPDQPVLRDVTGLPGGRYRTGRRLRHHHSVQRRLHGQDRPAPRRERPGLVAHRLTRPSDRPHQRATSSLRIYSEEMGDRTVEDALIRAAKRGVDVQVCGENESGEYDSAFAKLARTGIRISYYSSSTGFYIHGKVVEADYGTKHGKIFIGSENFSNTSLNQNRELGLIISSHAVMSAVAGTFASDFR